VLDQGIGTSTAVGRMFFQILGAIAEFEHALISERTRDGLEAARARGRTGGRSPNSAPVRSRLRGRWQTPLSRTWGSVRRTVRKRSDMLGDVLRA
jgi:DNA invertase Pin-like site-specific DNA recombinase